MKLPALCLLGVAVFGLVVLLVSGPRDPSPESVDPLANMVWIEGGEFIQGSENEALRGARPRHRVTVDGFWMDRTTVTNEQFEQFVKATRYVTLAELSLDQIVPGSLVFTPPGGAVPLDDYRVWWDYVAGASWRHPEGPASDL